MAKSQAGRNKIKCQKYRAINQRFINKLRRVRKNSGEKAADEYLIKHG